MRVKWSPFCNFRKPFFKKGGPGKGFPQKVFELIGTVELAAQFATILEQSGQLKKPGLELLQNPGCLSGEIMTKTRKAIETVRGYRVLLSVMFLNTLFQKNSTYPWVYFFCAPFDAAT